jgi:hypothetical protein
MPATPLVKFADQRNGGNGRQLFWGRSDVDNAPFRGVSSPREIMTQDEMEDRLVRVRDPHNRLFDLSDPADNTAYMAVVDKVVNGWAQMMFVKRVLSRNKKTGRVRVQVYCEWIQPYMEDGKPAMAQRPLASAPNEE